MQVVDNKLEKVLIFEDDFRIKPHFLRRLDYMFFEIRRLKLEWDLM